ncbi:hypothetical protein AYO41_05175, partial [Verrucomicrobia bacterium SCGC AG-212-E04]
MSYIDKRLVTGEKVVYRTHLHWLPILWPILWLFAGIYWISKGFDGRVYAWVFIVLPAFLNLVTRAVEWWTSEFGVSNKRVLIKTGVIRRHSVELLLNKIEGIQVEQGIRGRMLNFGTIVISGTGGSKEKFQRIASPMEFRRWVQEQISATANVFRTDATFLALPVSALPVPSEEKACPMCAEKVKAAAKICRFCAHNFDS